MTQATDGGQARSTVDPGADKPGHTPTGDYTPHSGDAFAVWLLTQRSLVVDNAQAWLLLDEVLGLYDRHIATGTPLSRHACGSGACDCFDQWRTGPGGR